MTELINQLFALLEILGALQGDDNGLAGTLAEMDRLFLRMETAMLAEPAVGSSLQSILVVISNRIYDRFHRHGLKTPYLHLLNRLDSLLDENAQPSHFRQALLKSQLAVHGRAIKAILDESGAPRPLLGAVETALTDIRRAHARPETLQYLMVFESGTARILPDADAGDLLIAANFNHPSLFAYFVGQYHEAELNADGLAQAEEYFMDRQAQLQYLMAKPSAPLLADAPALAIQLSDFIDTRLSWINQRQCQRRSEAQDTSDLRPGDRQELKVPVAMIGLLIRLFIVVGILPEDHAGNTFGFFARRFFTAKAPMISAHSLQNKANSVDFQTAVKFKELLIKMLNWLNAHFNLSSYKG